MERGQLSYPKLLNGSVDADYREFEGTSGAPHSGVRSPTTAKNEFRSFCRNVKNGRLYSGDFDSAILQLKLKIKHNFLKTSCMPIHNLLGKLGGGPLPFWLPVRH